MCEEEARELIHGLTIDEKLILYEMISEIIRKCEDPSEQHE